MHPGLAIVENCISDEGHFFFRDIDRDLSFRMPGRADEIEGVLSKADRQISPEGNRWLVWILIICLLVREEGGSARIVGRDRLSGVGKRVDLGRYPHEFFIKEGTSINS